MKEVLIDTDILSMYLRGNKKVKSKFKESCNKSADIYANLKRSGEIIDDVDILIAGICLESSLVLVTNNTKHFSRIQNIEIVNWSLSLSQ